MKISADELKHYEHLKSQLHEHSHAYYVLNEPKISDHVYDSLYQQLLDIEKKYPGLQSEDSPSLRVGDSPLEHFEKVLRKEKMMSLDNTYSKGELFAFHERILDKLDLNQENQIEYVCEPKIDGLAIECVYENGVLTLGSTRGDGLVGENVTQNLRTLTSIPLKIKPVDRFKNFVVRGEVFMNKKDFIVLNQQRKNENEKEFKNPRNAAAGSLRLLDAKITAQRPLRAIFYHLSSEVNVLATHAESLETLKFLGFPTHTEYSLCKSFDELYTCIEDWREKRLKLDYEIDGLVIKVNQISLQKKVGFTAKYPKWAIAYKYESEQAYTQILDVRVQVGRTGVLTPVADLQSVELGGTTVSRASLHNFEEIKRKDIRLHDFVWVEKAGEIIPKVMRVDLESRGKDVRKIKVPAKCPECGYKVGKLLEADVAIRCLNGFACPAQLKETVRYFCSRQAFNIENIGPSLIDQLIEKKYIQIPSDLFALDVKHLKDLERMGEKSAQNVVDALMYAKKHITYPKLLTALGIPLMGSVVAKLIAKETLSLKKLWDNYIEKDNLQLFEEVHGIGPKLVESMEHFFTQSYAQKLIKGLLDHGINPQYKVIQNANQILEGLTFCISGTLSVSRDDMKQTIESFGGKVSSSISSKTSYLLAGEKIGQNKLDAAKKYKIKLLNEEAFNKMIQA